MGQSLQRRKQSKAWVLVAAVWPMTAIPVTAHAASTLRVVCSGSNVGTEISVNGEFKGECPLEIRVEPGTVSVRGIKKVDATRERVFEQSLRLGADVVKQIEVVLSGPRVNPAQSAGSAPQAAKPPRLAAPAVASTATASLRPKLPFEISESVWKVIEASDAYRNLPRQQSIRIVHQASAETEYTGSENRSLPKPGVTITRSTQEITPLGDKCTATRTTTVVDGNPPNDHWNYSCGSIYFGYVMDGKTTSRLEAIDELNGSLFPMRIGNRQTLRSRTASAYGRQYDATHLFICEVMGRIVAREVDPRLSGGAWKLHCKTRYASSASTIDGEFDDYYLEDLAVMLSTIGRHDMINSTTSKFVLPSPGTQTSFSTEGPYGSRMTTSYSSYEWMTGSVASAQAAPLLAKATSFEDERQAQEQATSAQEKRLAESKQALENARRELARAQQEQPAQQSAQSETSETDSGFAAGLFGGLVSSLIDHNTAQINAAVGGSVAGNLFAEVNSSLADETKSRIAKDTGGSDAARLGNALGSAIGSGGASAGLGGSGTFGSGSNLATSALSGTAGIGSTGSGTAAAGSSSYASNKAAALRCQTETRNIKPWRNEQMDIPCQVASFEACIKRETGLVDYETQRRQRCVTIKGLARSLKANPNACPGCP